MKPTGVQKMEKATFGGGCFWGVEASFRQIKGVVSTSVGYIGGHKENPTYEDVCGKTTGHAEAVEVIFDPSQVSYEKLLENFWASHDPTQLNRQGPDIGDQYRSAIFYHNEAQKLAAEKSIEKLTEQGKFSRPIVTEVAAAGTYYLAEDYHQQYLEKRGLSSCGINKP
ncbi:MAG: peptide-methionine (S)-S-oxide reductase MsrA [bacterium]|nr:peptide-methionine (S)-S-oxide reductase MsrA [bacterium]